MESLFLALRVLLSLAVVLGLLWLLARRLRNGTRADRGGPAVNVVSRQAISPKASVVVVDVDGKRFLLGVTEQSVNVLHSEEMPLPLSGADVFAQSMSRAVEAPGDSETRSDLEIPAVLETYRRRAQSAPVQRRSGRRAARPVPPHYDQQNAGLAGSILSPNTWKQTAAVLRQGRNG